MAHSIAVMVGEHAQGRRVLSVCVAIGPDAGVERQALAFCWDIVTADSGLAGATLGFVEAEGKTFTVKNYEIWEDD